MAKRRFHIMTDSASDMPESYYKEHDIDVSELGLQINGKLYGGADGEKIDCKDFYARLRGGAMPTTTQVIPEQVTEHAEKYLAAGEDILAVVFSSGLSGTAYSFSAAAKELQKKYPQRKFFVVDSLAASMGEGLLLDYVIRKADEGASIEETRDYAEALKLHIAHWFTVEDLFHLKRGGRVSAATAVVGTMLNIKPVMHVDDDGHLIPVINKMGRKKSIRALVDYMDELQCMDENDPVFISHGDCEEDALFLKELIEQRFGKRKFIIHYVGAVIGSHSGAGTLALFFKANHR